jgi:diguanylate cyclase (GGDEF)-like protein/PAS domain S-box-containing protein
MIMAGPYDPLLVGTSVAVAIFASLTALNIAGRLLVAEGSAKALWLVTGSVALGGGIWSMHFVGMLAAVMPMPPAYDLGLTIMSLLVPMLGSAAGLYVVSRFGQTWRVILAGGLLIGMSIASMHYIGMAGMHMPGMDISYDPVLFAASLVIAVGASTAGLWLSGSLRGARDRIAAAIVLGSAICGMHYVAMAAARFTMVDHGAPMLHSGIEPAGLAMAVAAGAFFLLLLGLLTAFFDRKLAALTTHEAAALQQSEKRYRSLIESASDIIMIVDAGGTITYESSSAWHILGYRSEDVVGSRMTDLVPQDRRANVEAFLNALLEAPGVAVRVDVRAHGADGTGRDFEAVGRNLLHEPAIEGIVVNWREITERKRLMAALEKLSETDSLTGALNRRGFMKAAESEFQRLRGTGQALTVVMIDIDHFKRVNDTYGHAAGDLVLATVAAECQAHVRSGDMMARFGGEEFAFLLIEGAAAQVHNVVERLRAAIAATKIATIKGEVWVTASFGLATVDPDTQDLETALRLADEALYEAKNAGRNCIKIRA